MAVLSEPIAVVGTTVPDTWFTGTQAAVGPADAGALSLTVVDAADFDEGGGTLTIGDDPATAQTLDYADVDDETGVITLEEPLAATWPEGTRVTLEPPSREKYAQVMVGDFGEAVDVEIPHGLWNKIADGIRPDGDGEVVQFHMEGGRFVLDEPVGSAPVVDGGYLDQETTPPETFMDGSLYGLIGFVDGGFVAGDPLGAYVEMSAAGITAADASGAQTFQIDALTGNVTTVGMFASSLTPDEAHIVMGDLAGSGASKSFVYFYTGEELNPDGTPIAGAFPGQVSSGIDATDGTRYIELRSPDLSTVHPGVLTLNSSPDLTASANLEWSGDIRLRGDLGIVYALDDTDARAPLTIEGSALVLDVPNGTMRLGDSGAGANKLRSRNTADTARRAFELEADTALFDVTSGTATMRGPTSGRFQLANQAGDVGIVFLDSAGLRVSNWASAGHRPIAASSFDVNSDAVNKTSMSDVDPAAALTAVRGVTVYDYTRKEDQRRQRGLLAQDVEAAIPIAAVDYSDEDTMSVDLYGLITTTLAACQAIATRLEAVEAKTDKLPAPKVK